MSEGDFEVMPRGTMEEVKALRAFARTIIDLDGKYGINTPQVLREEIHKIHRFYANHVERYPSNGL